MATQYDDLYARANLADTGLIPKVGGLCGSPDIIPIGQKPVDNPSIFKSNWDKDVGIDLQANQPNYIYMRAKNLSPAHADGKVSLYYCMSSLLMYPYQWANNIIKTSDGASSVDIKADKGEIVVAGNPFNWIAPPQGSDWHWCLVGRIATEKNPNELPNMSRISDFAYYVATTPGISWRNVTVINKDAADYSSNLQYDQGKEGGTMHFGLACTKLPIGSEVKFSCGTPGPNPPIYMEKTKITNYPYQDFYTHTVIPADFSSFITYSYWSNGQKTKAGDQMEIKLDVYYEPSEKNDKLYALARPIVNDAGITVGPHHVIPVGSHKTIGT
jgi:hypothetical protein